MVVSSLTRVTSKTSPTFPRRVGPGAIPPKVHIRCRTPGATSTVRCRTCRPILCTVAPAAGARAASRECQPAEKSADRSGPEPSEAVAEWPSWPSAPWAAVRPPPSAVPVAAMSSVIPAARCPGTVHHPLRSPVSVPRSRVRVWPSESSEVVGPSSILRSCRCASRLVTFRRSAVPRGTSIRLGLTRMSCRETATVRVPVAAPPVPAPDAVVVPPPAPPPATRTARAVATAAAAVPMSTGARGVTTAPPAGPAP